MLYRFAYFRQKVSGIKIGIIPEAGHDLGVILQDRVRVLEVRCQTAVLGLDRPAIAQPA